MHLHLSALVVVELLADRSLEVMETDRFELDTAIPLNRLILNSYKGGGGAT